MLLTMHVVNSNGECASPHYDNTVQPRLSRFLDYPDLFLCSKFFMNINLFYFVSTAKLFSFKLCTMWTEFIALQSTNLYTFCTLTDRVHFTELWDLLCCCGKFHLLFSKLCSFVLGSLIFVFSFIQTLDFPLSPVLTSLDSRGLTIQITQIQDSFLFVMLIEFWYVDVQFS